MAQFEIEIKLPLKNLKETLEILTDQGFHETAEIREEDTYFNSVYHDVKKRDEALRIRTSTDCRSGISKTQINFKGPKPNFFDIFLIPLQFIFPGNRISPINLCQS